MAEEVKEEYRSSLHELTFNSKPHINFLTMLAEENVQFAAEIVSVIESHISQAPKNQKLPVLYLIDSIVKNCAGSGYGDLFAKNLVKTFAGVFDAVDEKTRQAMFKLRQTWTDFFPASRLCLLDIKVHQIDPAWPVTPTVPPALGPSATIHVNPNFVAPAPTGGTEKRNEKDLRQERQELMLKQQEAIRMKQNRKAMELEAAKTKVVGAAKSSSQPLKSVVTVPSTSQQDPRLKRVKEEPKEVSRSDSSAGRSSVSSHRQKSPESTSSRRDSDSQRRPPSANGSRSSASETGKKSSYHRLDKPYGRSSVDLARVKREESYSPELMSSTDGILGGSSRAGRSQMADITEVFEDFEDGPRPAKASRTAAPISINLGYTGSRRRRMDVAAADSTVDSSADVVSSSDSIADSPGEVVRSGVGSLDSPRTGSPNQSNGRDVDLREARNLPLKKRKRGGTDTDSDTQKAPSPLVLSESEGSDQGPREKRSKQTAVVNVDSSGDEGGSLFGGKDVDLRTARIIGPIKPTNIKKEIIEDIENESGRRDRRGRQTKPVDQPVSPWLPQAQPVVQAAMAAQPDLMSTNWAALSLNQRDQLAVAADSQFRNGQIQRDQYDMIVRNLQALPGAAPWPGVGGIQVQPVMQNPYQFPVKREFDFCQFEPNDQRMMRGYAGGRMQVDLNRPSGKDPAEKEKTPAAIPANKTIYVGRTGYEVQYINDVAFIERNGLPHRIYFVGPPRDVVVDGTPYLLAFGETKTITIDGQQHTIRFGGPGRELIMGGFPFRGFFDGAPILATINNVAHKIQLCGPAPEVKIDPEPDYELSRDCAIAHKQNLQRNPYHDSRAAPTPGTSGMRPQQNYYSNENVYGMAPMVNPMLNAQTSVVPQAMPQPLVNQQPMPLTTAVANVLPQWDRPAAVPLAATVAGVQPVVSTPAAIPQTVSPTPSATFSLDVNDLLKKLMTKGLIGNPQTAQASDSRQAETDVRASPPRRSDWSGRKDVGQPGVKHILEKRDAPPSTLIEFQLKDLKIRYQSVVNKLYPEGLQCGNCGLRFADSDDEKYSRHLDWHFQLNKKEKDKRAPSRPWYLVAEDWSNVEEMADESAATRAKSSVFEKDDQQKSEAAKAPAVTSVSVVPANDKHTTCDICKEEFELFYDEDEEIWNFRNAVKIGGKIYHPVCYEDVPDTPTIESAAIVSMDRFDTAPDQMEPASVPTEVGTPPRTQSASDQVEVKRELIEPEENEKI